VALITVCSVMPDSDASPLNWIATANYLRAQAPVTLTEFAYENAFG